jgi:hypothetical protein
MVDRGFELLRRYRLGGENEENPKQVLEKWFVEHAELILLLASHSVQKEESGAVPAKKDTLAERQATGKYGVAVGFALVRSSLRPNRICSVITRQKRHRDGTQRGIGIVQVRYDAKMENPREALTKVYAERMDNPMDSRAWKPFHWKIHKLGGRIDYYVCVVDEPSFRPKSRLGTWGFCGPEQWETDEFCLPSTTVPVDPELKGMLSFATYAALGEQSQEREMEDGTTEVEEG